MRAWETTGWRITCDAMLDMLIDELREETSETKEGWGWSENKRIADRVNEQMVVSA